MIGESGKRVNGARIEVGKMKSVPYWEKCCPFIALISSDDAAV